MVLRHRFTLLCLAVALCAGAVSPASALSAERVVRPVQTYTLDSGWSVTPASALAHDALADAVADPAAPDTTTGYLATAKTGAVAEAGFAAPAITTGETVTGARLHTYFETGSNRSLFVELRSGASLLGWTIVPAGQAAGWHDVGAWATPTLAQLGDLRIRATVSGNGASSEVKVYAAYVAVTTTTPASTTTTTTGGDTPVSTDPGTDPGTSTGGDHAGSGASGDAPATGAPLPAEAVVLPVQTLKAAANGALGVPLTCRLAAGCTGTITTRLVGNAARSARRRKVNNKRSKSRNRFRLAAGQSKRVPVQLDRRTSRFVRRKGKAKVAVTIAIDGAAPVTKQVTVVERRTSGRRK